MNFVSYLLIFHLASTTSSLALDLCAQSFCKCPEAGKRVVCECENRNQAFDIDRTSLPKQAETFSLQNCGSVTVKTNSFSHCLDLKKINFSHLKHLHLKSRFYSTSESGYKELSNFTLEQVGKVTIDPEAFVHFPKTGIADLVDVGIPKIPTRGLEILTDTLTIKNSNIGTLVESSIYSDAGLLSILNNRIEKMGKGAFDASVREFEFIGNTVDFVEHMGLSVACLNGRVLNNTFTNQSGSPFLDFGPDPVCVPDPDSDPYEEDIDYNVVANPELEFSGNTFQTFTNELLSFPGANNVPLGALTIQGNKVNCDCETMREFFALVDFEHVVSSDLPPMNLGAILFRKEFYNTGLCSGMGDKPAKSLKAFARGWTIIKQTETESQPSLQCSKASAKKYVLKFNKEKSVKETSKRKQEEEDEKSSITNIVFTPTDNTDTSDPSKGQLNTGVPNLKTSTKLKYFCFALAFTWNGFLL